MRKIRGFQVRDFREKGFFMVDNIYVNGYAKKLGPHATAVYLSLCRHADKEQRCFPSQDLISEELGMHRRTVIRKLKLLEEWNMIKKEKHRADKGKYVNNIYYLLDKSEWKTIPCDTESHGQPCDREYENHVTQSHTKETNKKDTHNNSDEKENVENFVYKSLKWAYGRANGQPDCPKLAFEKSVRRAINEHGLEAVYDKFEYEDNAIQFLYNIKNL